MNEIWKSVVGYEGWYSVSSLGQIRRDCRGPATQAGRIIKQCLNGPGYFHVTLCKNKTRRTAKVHVLVAYAFLGDRPNNLHINHKNRIKTDNRAKNLEYITSLDNHIHNFKLKAEDVLAIRERFAKGGILKTELAKVYKITPEHLGQIILRKKWNHV